MGRVALILVVILLAEILACDKPAAPSMKSSDATSPALSNDFERDEPTRQKIDPLKLNELLSRIRDHTYKNVHAVLLVRNGKLVVEEYFPGTDSAGAAHVYDRDVLHEIHSATKSITGLLIGIAIDQRQIAGANVRVSGFFPEYAALFADGREEIELRHLLSMTAGLSWDEWGYPYTDPRNSHVAMNACDDPLRYVFSQPMVAAPGTKFSYSSGISIALGEIVHRATGLTADRFAALQLFEPLGITRYAWAKYPDGMVQAGGGLAMRPYDMAKIGSMLADGGRWRGRQIISEAWIRESTTQHAPDRDYGYQWWLGKFPVGGRIIPAFGAQGRGGQFIIVIPDLRLTAVFTSWNDDALWDQPIDMLNRNILSAIAD